MKYLNVDFCKVAKLQSYKVSELESSKVFLKDEKGFKLLRCKVSQFVLQVLKDIFFKNDFRL